ncbi:MAG: hypothetical protein GF350_15110 [Chitinivibrionales bacterium]|nr:hypothetical protein [Chitinivibrionales bacterium]
MHDFPFPTPGKLRKDYDFPDEMIVDPDLIDEIGPQIGDGTGLHVQYFARSALSGTPTETKTEPYLGINWGSSKNVRLTGSIVPFYSGEHRFCANLRRIVKVWNDQLVVNGSGSGPNVRVKGKRINLTAATPYPIKVEFTDGNALVYCISNTCVIAGSYFRSC